MAADNAPMMEEFTWEQCLSLLDECERCGVQTITLTGGEPMLHPKFMDIVRECAKRRLYITDINTNGSFLTAEMLEEWKSLGVEQIRIIRTTEAPRWNENGRGMCLDILEYYDEMLKLMARLVKAGLAIGVDVWQFAYYYPWTKRYYFHPVQTDCERYRDSIPVCRGARGTIAVAHTGELSPCNQMSGSLAKLGIRLGNVKEQPLHQLLSGSDYLDTVTTPVSVVKEKNARCQACQYWQVCMGGCRAIATAFAEDMLHYAPSKCAFFKGGYMKKIDDAFAEADPAYRCGNSTGGMAREGEQAAQ